MGATKNKERDLDNQESLKEQGAHSGLIDKVDFLHKTTLSRLGVVTGLSNTQKPTQRGNKVKKQGNMFQTKEQYKSETNLNGTEISDLSNT